MWSYEEYEHIVRLVNDRRMRSITSACSGPPIKSSKKCCSVVTVASCLWRTTSMTLSKHDFPSRSQWRIVHFITLAWLTVAPFCIRGIIPNVGDNLFVYPGVEPSTVINIFHFQGLNYRITIRRDPFFRQLVENEVIINTKSEWRHSSCNIPHNDAFVIISVTKIVNWYVYLFVRSF